jgi:predicted nucleic acid-binding protein
LIILDTSVALAFMDAGDEDHERVRDWIGAMSEELSTTPLIVAELDHLVSRRGGRTATRALREDLDRGAYLIEWWPSAIHEATSVAKRYESLELGLADASLVALAAHLQTIDIATLDEPHFRALKPLSGGKAFRLLPADAG